MKKYCLLLLKQDNGGSMKYNKTKWVAIIGLVVLVIYALAALVFYKDPNLVKHLIELFKIITGAMGIAVVIDGVHSIIDFIKERFSDTDKDD